MSNSESSRHIRIHIDRLSLRGFDAGKSQTIGGEVKTALAGIIRDHGLDPGKASRQIRGKYEAAPIKVQRGADAQDIGRQIAERIYGGLLR